MISGVQNHLKPYFNELKGKTWGVIGLGNIGQRTADIAYALSMKIVSNSRRYHEGYEWLELDELCKVADIISVHVPLTSQTKGMIDEKRISLMKDGVIFINVSRGAVADENALVTAVENGKIGGLGVDVYSVEPITNDSPYNRILDRSNVILTPVSYTHLITFGTMKAKLAIRDVGRALDIPYAEVDKVAKLVPFDLKMTISKACLLYTSRCV